MKVTKKSGWFVWVVVGLLATHVAGMMTAVYVATGDRTFVAMPDYYSRSVQWDQRRELARQSDALGWTRTISLSPADEQGRRTLSIRVADRSGAPVAGLEARASLYPEMFPNLVQKVVLTDGGEGTYTTQYAKPAHGPLVIELVASRGGETFVTQATLMVGGRQ
jgi:nitrogen fixation protein FixH